MTNNPEINHYTINSLPNYIYQDNYRLSNEIKLMSFDKKRADFLNTDFTVGVWKRK